MRAERIIRMLSNVGQVEYLDPLQGGDCQGSRHHSPRPLLTYRYDLSKIEAGAPAPADDEEASEAHVDLCSTCYDNLCVYLSVLFAYRGDPHQAVRRDFGNIIRFMGERAWALQDTSCR